MKPAGPTNAHRAQKQRHAVELQRVVQNIYRKEQEEYEKHEERLRERQSNTSMLFFHDVERTAKSGFVYFDVESTSRGRRVRLNRASSLTITG